MVSEKSSGSGDDTPTRIVDGAKPRPPRDRRHGLGTLIRPHGGAETRVKSGKRAEAPSDTTPGKKR
ncbi:MAG: hypothetical protein ABWX83_13115 [Luteibacter sp.]